jgi:hypothetical protein
MARSKNSVRITAEQFVKAWQRATSVADFCKATGMRETVARQRASVYRRRGIPLRRMGNAPTPLDVSRLATLAKKYEPKG